MDRRVRSWGTKEGRESEGGGGRCDFFQRKPGEKSGEYTAAVYCITQGNTATVVDGNARKYTAVPVVTTLDVAL